MQFIYLRELSSLTSGEEDATVSGPCPPFILWIQFYSNIVLIFVLLLTVTADFWIVYQFALLKFVPSDVLMSVSEWFNLTFPH